MNAEQIGEFTAAAGHPPRELLDLIAAAVIVGFLLWTVWVGYGQLRAWQQGEIGMYDLMWTLVRASIVLLLAGWYIRP